MLGPDVSGGRAYDIRTKTEAAPVGATLYSSCRRNAGATTVDTPGRSVSKSTEPKVILVCHHVSSLLHANPRSWHSACNEGGYTQRIMAPPLTPRRRGEPLT